MATRQRRLEIVIAWMQQHPGVVKDVQTKLNSLAGSYGFLRRNVGQLNLTQDEQAVYMRELSNIYNEMRVSTGASQQTVNMMNKALKATSFEMEKAAAPAEKTRKRMLELGASYNYLLSNIDALGLSADEQVKFADNLAEVFKEMGTATQMGATASAMYNRALKMTTTEIAKAAAPAERVRARILELGESYRYLLGNIDKMGLSAEDQIKFADNLTKVFEQMRESAQMGVTTSAMYDKALKATTGETGKAAATMDIFDKILQRMGYRTAWVGYRMAIMGRLLTRAVLQPMQQMLGALTGWEKSMESAALALALQEAGMGETGLSAEELRQTILDLAESGMSTQTAMGGLQATWAALATENAPALNKIIGEMQRALEGVGGAIITSMVDTISDALPWLGDLLEDLKPFSGILGNAAAYMLVFGIALTAIGTAIYLARPALLVLKGLFSPITLVVLELIAVLLILKNIVEAWPSEVERIKEMWKYAGVPVGEIPEEVYKYKSRREMYEAARGGGPQDIDIDVNIDIENIAGEVDVDAMVKKISDEMAEKLRLRGFP